MINLQSGMIFGTSGIFNYEDSYNLDSNHKVIFLCPNKDKVVTGILTGSLSFGVSSKWESWLSSNSGSIGGGAYKIINTVDSLAQAFTGNTIRQPWLGRKLWRGTDPIQLKVPMTFIADAAPLTTQFSNKTLAYQNVWLPVIGLVSMCYPRKTKGTANLGVKGLSAFLYKIPGPSFFDTASTSTNSEGETVHAGDNFAADDTGFSPVSKAYAGDSVIVRIGKSITFAQAYLEDLQIELSSSLDEQGYPNAAKVVATVSAQDNSYVSEDGSFMLHGLEPVRFVNDSSAEAKIAS